MTNRKKSLYLHIGAGNKKGPKIKSAIGKTLNIGTLIALAQSLCTQREPEMEYRDRAGRSGCSVWGNGRLCLFYLLTKQS